MAILDRLRVRVAIVQPSPSPPRRFSSGTLQSSKTTSVMTVPFNPIFSSRFPKRSPGVPSSTTKAESPLWPSFRTGHGKDRIEPGNPSIGDEAFLTIEKIMVLLLFSPRLERGCLQPAIRFVQGKGSQVVLFSNLGEKALFLRRISSQEDRHGTDSLGKNHEGMKSHRPLRSLQPPGKRK